MIFNQTIAHGGTLKDVSAEFAALNPDCSFVKAVVDEGERNVFVYASVEGLVGIAPFFVPFQYAVDQSVYTDGMYWCIVNGGGTLDVVLWNDSSACFPLDEMSTDFGGTCFLSASWQY